MSRYQELQASLNKRITEISSYWDDMRDAAKNICESFESSLELPSPHFKNIAGRDEAFVKLGSVTSGKFTGTNPERLAQSGSALEFAISLTVFSSTGEYAEIVIPVKVSRKGSDYSLLLVNSGRTLVATFGNFDDLAEGIYEEIQRMMSVRP